MQILPVASGKGGVGKSLFAANLSIALAQAGRQVVLADLDLGASNLHVMLGIGGVRQGLGVYLSNSTVEFKDILLKTEIENLSFIPGDGEIPGMANLKSWQKRKLIKQLQALDADYVILDCGGGTNFNVLDFFLASGNGIIISSPLPTSILNAYLFLKNAVFRLMSATFKRGSAARHYIQELLKKGTELQKVYLPTLFQAIEAMDADSFGQFQITLNRFQPALILNLLEDPEDAEQGDKLRRSCKEYLNLELTHLGILYRDDLQDVALRAGIPLMKYRPDAMLSQSICRVSEKLMYQEADRSFPIDCDSLNEQFETAKIEAEVDFEVKLRYLEQLLHTEELTVAGVTEAAKAQHIEIERLKYENRLLKSKLDTVASSSGASRSVAASSGAASSVAASSGGTRNDRR